ncbi:hypothetical protein F5Y12DRAFT_184553 [Xylaria sp. FL1777]|nr:hypothetical protein F5Y12DRAFT_184553 [Xylaria sp. FL1777]
MSPILGLIARIAESGQRSQGSQDGTEYHHIEYRETNDDNNGGGGLPWYVVFLVVYFTVLFLVFWSSLIYYWTREKENRRRDGQPFRTGHVVWQACSVAIGLRAWIWVFERQGWCGSDRKQNRAAGVGPYEKIRSRRTPAAIGVSASSPTPSASAPATNPHTPSHPYGVPASQGTTYAPYEQPSDIFKSPGHNPNYQASTQPDSIPMITLSPSPSVRSGPNPNTGYAPPPPPPPPPYISTPPPAALYGQKFESKHAGPMY